MAQATIPSLSSLIAGISTPPVRRRSALGNEMAQFVAMTDAWADMADAAQAVDEAGYRAAKTRFQAAAGRR